MNPEEWKKERDSYLGWFFTVQIGGSVIYYVTAYTNISQGYLPSVPSLFLPIVTWFASICAMLSLYNWAKYKGQSGWWAIWGILNLLGIIIGAIVLGPMPVVNSDEKQPAQPAPQIRPPAPTQMPTASQNPVVIPPVRTESTRTPSSDKKEEVGDFEKRAAALERFAQLKDKGIITEEEYNQQKKKILGS